MRSVKIKLGKKTRNLKYTWGALRYLKDTHGLVVGSIDQMADDWTLFGPWLVAGLRHEDPDITLEDLDDVLPISTEAATMVVEKVIQALGVAEQSDVPQDPTVTLQTTTGANSIKSPSAA